MDGEALSDLLARVEAAEGADRELDALIEVAVRKVEAARTGLSPKHWATWRASRSGGVGDGFTLYQAPFVSASLDASLALVERVLPGWRWERQWEPGGEFIRLLAPDYHANTYKGALNRSATGWCSCWRGDALALLAALLRALIAESATAVPVNEEEGNTASRAHPVFASNGDSNAEPSGGSR